MRKSYKGLHKVGTTDIQRAIANLDRDVSHMVLARDRECITCGSTTEQCDCGHFRIRQNMATRFHPLNCNRQGTKENRFEGGKTFEYGLALDKKYGKGCAIFLEKLSRTIENWTEGELATLREAAKIGERVYEDIYYGLRPTHQFKKLIKK